MTTAGTTGTTHASMVNSCVATSATATIYISGSSTSFAVYIRNAGLWKYTASSGNILSAVASNYGV